MQKTQLYEQTNAGRTCKDSPTEAQPQPNGDPAQRNLLNVLTIKSKWYDHASWLLLPAGGPIWVGLINSRRYNR